MSTPLTSPAIDIVQYEEEAIGETEVLPAIITYDGFELHTIANKGRGIIKPSENTALDALFLYYGKYIDWSKDPSINTDYLTNEEALYCPICLVLDFQKLMADNKIGEIFPFDPKSCSGRLDSNDYRLENSLEEIFRYIRLYYGSIDNYLKGIANCSLETDDTKTYSLEVDTLMKLHKMEPFNEKAHTISLKIVENIDLLDYLKCIIIPKKAKRFFGPLLTAKNITCLEYKTGMHKAPSFYNAIVCELYMKFIGREVTFYD